MRTVTNLAWFHCFSGIAGDMALGSLVDAGADLDEVRGLLERLPVGGWAVEAEPVLRCGIAATHVQVHAEENSVVRTAANITDLVEQAKLPSRVAERSLATFHALAEAEGRLHRRPPEQVHFHEVGGIDAIVDVVGTCAALEVLEVDEVHASAVATGTGMVRAAHGHLPNPAPAVVELLQGAPVHGVDVPVELTTPTGAALLAANVVGWGAMPAMRLTATGFGAGSREIDGQPNATQVVLGTADLRRSAGGAAIGDPMAGAGQPVVLIETNVDDVTGEVLAHAVGALMAAGAHDAWITPILMKKGRPAYTVSALADPALAGQVATALTAETGTLGVRGQTLGRWPAARSGATVEVGGAGGAAGGPVRVKVSPGRVKPEPDDAAHLAQEQGRPLRDVLAEAEAAARTRLVPQPDAGASSGPSGGSGAGGEDDREVVPLHDHDHPHPHPHDES